MGVLREISIIEMKSKCFWTFKNIILCFLLVPLVLEGKLETYLGIRQKIDGEIGEKRLRSDWKKWSFVAFVIVFANNPERLLTCLPFLPC